MTTTLLQRIAAPALPASRRLGRGLGAVLDLLLRGWDRSRQRRALESLDDAMLRDLGISRADVMREAAKPFWRD